jgi:hypothetical protein
MTHRLEDEMTSYDRVSVIVGVILVGIVLFLVIEIPPRVFQFSPLGTPLTLHVTGIWAVTMLLVGLSCAGTEAVLRTHPTVRRGTIRHTFPGWILPALVTLALAVVLPGSPDLLNWLIGLAIGGGLLAWLILMNYQAFGNDARSIAIARAGLRLAAYPLALILFTLIYRTRLRSLVTATAVTWIASLLSLSVLHSLGQAQRLEGRTALYAGVIGLLLGETTWALNYWRANALTVGVLLMLLFYVLTGIVRTYTQGEIDRRTVIEFLIVAALGIWIVVRFGPT